MKKAILATKVGMTQIFNENGGLRPKRMTVTKQYRLVSLIREKNLLTNHRKATLIRLAYLTRDM